MNGTDLLAEFKRTRAEAAFGELVRRYTNLVYSAAYRRLNNSSHAQEVAQLVFIRLAKAVPTLHSDAELAAWLHRTTVHVSIDLWRSEKRRHVREEHAAAMQPEATDTPAWSTIAPLLDEALNDLADADRQALLLRFFEQKSMRELGLAVGISEDAAKMRVSRALERLRTLFGQRGIQCSALALGAVLAEQAVEAVPGEVAAALAALPVPVAAAGTGTGLATVLFEGTKAKLLAGLAAALVVGGCAWWMLHARSMSGRKLSAATPRAVQPALAGPADEASNAASVAAAPEPGGPDPRKLLQAVAAARNRLSSGELEYEVAAYEFNRPYDGTNQTHLKALFLDNQRRFESFTREYAYVSLDPDTNAAAEARIRAEHLDRVAAIQAGLISAFDSHHRTIYDGAVLMDWWDEGNGHPRTVIRDPAKGSSSYAFDPRVLGLANWAGPNLTVENCLAYAGAKAVQLLGEEAVQGVAAWHIQVQTGYGEKLHFWLEAAHPVRVLKCIRGEDVVLSKYDPSDAGSVLPVEVQISEARNGTLRSARRFTCTRLRLGVAVTPQTFTLAGLGMAVGTEVIDERLQRQIGYWTGSGLSGQFLRPGTAPQSAPDRTRMLALLEEEPSSPAALDAAEWLLFNTPDGPEVEQAARVILQEHIQSTNLVHLTLELERLRPRCATNLLTAMLEQNPLPAVRGNACFSLATLRKEQAGYGKNPPATAEAEKLFERVVTDFAQVQRQGTPLGQLAQTQLADLRQLSLGKPAPLTEGETLGGQSLKLSDYRGKVVVLNFWGACGGCRPEMAALLKLLDRLQGQPVVLLGVYGDDDLEQAKAIVEELGMTWPSFRDGRNGPIGKAWHNEGWPLFDVVDPQGIIRYRNLTQGEMARALETMLKP